MRRLITQRNIDERKARLAAGEEDNFPKGNRTMHSFVTDRKLRNNEEMCERNPDGTYVLSENEVLGIPAGRKTLVTAQLKNSTAKCCRLIFTMNKASIASIFRVHGEGIATFQAAQGGDESLGIDNDPPFGFDMQNPVEGYPCVNLLPSGKCGIHEAKPQRCAGFPEKAIHLDGGFGEAITSCSVTFDADGNKLTLCDGCGAF